ncbi:hypothetical protein C1637_14965 [Chryseobacterium lactis]|uniref:DUF1569 domain-containing protein n=1 Tax=Chryseobacterium lactis TaxID=1241981 RepID=A0A3G6RZU1_CHRLC|nr:DUF1569 domain-containing protein [Chryseobacterium lactis]AZB07160.1 DUF1569 domain-containing protein [Chryseobacterium lactis]PNW13274.1 hypothetical protein C1637_14965 [Chryseobacterium lactis]
MSKLTKDSPKKWGQMDVSQMLRHCDLVLQVALKKIELPPINPVFKTIGVITKVEMYVFNNGIPRNMPTFQKLIVNFECDFDESKTNLLKTLEEFRAACQNKTLPDHHRLFGTMTEKDWEFLEYKHLDHHLKQFNV